VRALLIVAALLCAAPAGAAPPRGSTASEIAALDRVLAVHQDVWLANSLALGTLPLLGFRLLPWRPPALPQFTVAQTAGWLPAVASLGATAHARALLRTFGPEGAARRLRGFSVGVGAAGGVMSGLTFLSSITLLLWSDPSLIVGLGGVSLALVFAGVTYGVLAQELTVRAGRARIGVGPGGVQLWF